MRFVLFVLLASLAVAAPMYADEPGSVPFDASLVDNPEQLAQFLKQFRESSSIALLQEEQIALLQHEQREILNRHEWEVARYQEELERKDYLIRSLEASNQELQKQVSDLFSAQEHAARLEDILADRDAKVQHLTNDLHEVKERCEELTDVLYSESERFCSVLAQLDGARDELANAWETANQRQEQKEVLQRELGACRDDKTDLQLALSEAEQQIRTTSTTNQQLSSQLQTTEQAYRKLEDRCDSLSETIASNANDFEELIGHLEQAREEITATKQLAAEQENDLENLSTALQNRDQRIAALEANTTNLQTALTSHRDEYTSHEQQWKQRCDELEQQLLTLEETNAKLQETTASQLRAEGLAKEVLQERCVDLSTQIAALHDDLLTKETSIADLSMSLEQQSATLSATKETEQTWQNHASELEDLLKEAYEERNASLTRCSKLEEILASEAQRHTALKAQLSACQTEIERLDQALEERNRAIATKTQEWQLHHQDLTDERDAAIAHCSELETQLAHETAHLQDQLAALDHALTQSESTLEENQYTWEQECQELASANEHIHTRCVELESLLEQENLAHRAANDQITQLQERLQLRDEQVTSLDQILEERNLAMAANDHYWNQQANELQQQVDELSLARNTSQARCEELQELVEQTSATSQAAHQQISQLQEHISRLNQEAEQESLAHTEQEQAWEEQSYELAAARDLAIERSLELHTLLEQESAAHQTTQQKFGAFESQIAEMELLLEERTLALAASDDYWNEKTQEWQQHHQELSSSRDMALARLSELQEMLDQESLANQDASHQIAELQGRLALREEQIVSLDNTLEERNLSIATSDEYWTKQSQAWDKQFQELTSARDIALEQCSELQEILEKESHINQDTNSQIAHLQQTLEGRELALAEQVGLYETTRDHCIQLEHQLDQTTTLIEEHNLAKQTAEQTIQYLQQTTAQLEQELDQSLDQQEIAFAQCQELETLLSQATQQHTTLADAMDEQVERERLARQIIEDRCTELHQLLTAGEQQLLELTEEMALTHERAELVEQQLTTLHQSSSDSEEQIAALSTHNASLCAELDSLHHLNDQYQELQAQYSTVCAQLGATQGELDDLAARYQEATSQLDQYALASEALPELQAEKLSLESTCKELRDSCALAQAQTSDLQLALTAANDRVETMESQFALATEQRLAEEQQRLQQLEIALETERAKCEQLHQELQVAEGNLERKEHTIATLQEEKELKEIQIEALLDDESVIQDAYQAQMGTVLDQEEAITSLQSRLEQVTTDLSATKTKLDSTQAAYEDECNQRMEKDSVIAYLEEQLLQQQELISSIEQQQQFTAAEAAQYSNAYDKELADRTAMETQIGELAALSQEKDVQVTKAQNDVDAFQAQVAELTEQMAALTTERDALSTECGSLRDEVTNLHQVAQRFDDAQTALALVQSERETIAHQLITLTTERDALSTECGSLRDEVTNLHQVAQRFDDAQTALALVQSEKETIADQLITLTTENQDLSSSKKQLAEVSAVNEDLEQRLATLTTQLERTLEKHEYELDRAREKYEYELALRRDSDEQLGRLTATVTDQQNALRKLEQAKVQLQDELVELREYESELLNERLARTKPSRQSFSMPRRGAGAVTRVHIVGQDENLTSIAKQYRISVQELYDANRDSLPNQHEIRVGTALLIP